MTDKRFKIQLPEGCIKEVEEKEFLQGTITTYHGHITQSLVIGCPTKSKRRLLVRTDSSGNLLLEVKDE